MSEFIFVIGFQNTRFYERKKEKKKKKGGRRHCPRGMATPRNLTAEFSTGDELMLLPLAVPL